MKRRKMEILQKRVEKEVGKCESLPESRGLVPQEYEGGA
jgi:hypothetical protein